MGLSKRSHGKKLAKRISSHHLILKMTFCAKYTQQTEKSSYTLYFSLKEKLKWQNLLTTMGGVFSKPDFHTRLLNMMEGILK
jgi:hypothetical protein